MMPPSRQTNSLAQFIAIIAATLLIVAPLPAVAAPPDDPAADQAMSTISPDAIRADMRFLADDALEGRGTATRGHEIAAKYMATRFEGMGLQPAGDNNSYFQSVPVRSLRTNTEKSSLTIARNGTPLSLTSHVDFIIEPDPVAPDVSVEGPVVFAGFGVTAPNQNYDDYKSLDVKGKIVALAQGAPNFPSSINAHYSAFEVKAKIAADHGAIGIIAIEDPVSEAMYPFAKFVRDLVNPEFRWLDKEGHPNDYLPQIKAGAFLSIDATKQLFEGSGHSADEIFAGAKDGKLAVFPLPVAAKIHVVTESKDLRSPNVVARFEGSDPILKGEYLVYTAHLDHLGIGEPKKGDPIYNGALDNASGSATILEVAQAFARMNPRPRRSILFVSVTGEEAGELGSEYFAHYPTVAKHSIVANINIDQVFMLYPLADVIAFGAEHTSLESVIQRAAKKVGIVESPDPMPEQVVFIRSDQYSFVKQGIPAVMPSPGFKSPDGSKHAWDIAMKWMDDTYHEPNDDMNQPNLDFDAAAKFAQFTFLCGYYVTQDTPRPTWNKGDFFGDQYAHLAQ
jgi:Zn-dependent M28 family amino/carboxypeptidase